MAIKKGTWPKLERLYSDSYESFSMFAKEVRTRVTEDRDIVSQSPRVVYTVKHRIKDLESLKKKVEDSNRNIGERNFFKQISDIAGARVVVLHRSQIFSLHKVVLRNLNEKRWKLREVPVAYENDALAKKEFTGLKFKVVEKESYYTSVHYLIEQISDPRICCELQIRTIFEEVWGEVDHFLRYKRKGLANTANMKRLEHELRTFSYTTQTARSVLDLLFLVKPN